MRLVAAALLVLGAAPAAAQDLWQVGPMRELRLPSEAAARARDGDTVEIDAGQYSGDVAIWPQSGLTIRGQGGHAVLDAAGREGRAIWLVRGDGVRIERITFTNAKASSRNGAGILHEGGRLTVVDCRFEDNENGILTANNPRIELTIERSEFARNGHHSGYAHGLYVGTGRRLTVKASYFHGTPVGHLLKSRAALNVIAFNRLMDERDGYASYGIDLPNGGTAYVVGNLIQQGRRAENERIVAFKMESERPGDDRLVAVNNTIVNELGGGTFFALRGGEAQIVNNILIGGGHVLQGKGTLIANLLVPFNGAPPQVEGALNGAPNWGNRRASDARLVDLWGYDYRLTASSPALRMAIDPARVLGVTLRLDGEYAHPHALRPRRAGPPFDAGAFAMK
jgi:hypothetical protein